MSGNAGPRPPRVGDWRITALLLLSCACGRSPTNPDATGGIDVLVTTEGVSVDTDGYTVTLQLADFGQSSPIVDRVGTNDILRVSSLDPGPYSVTLTDVRPTCTVSSTEPPLVDVIRVNATVSAGHTTLIQLHLTCRPPPPGRLVFVGAGGLTTINADGSGLRLLNTDSLYKAEPAWSRDGTRIAWVHGDHIEVINADGSGRVTLAPGNSPSWSPDGTRLVFSSGGQLYTMGSDGSGVTPLTEGFSNALYPDWSPTSDRIAFSGSRDGASGIYLIGADGSGVVQLTTAILYDNSLAWSPDGTRIAFNRMWRRNTDGDIFVMHADGSGITKVTHFTGDTPAWSPDGTKIVYRKDPGDLYFIAVDGTQEGLFIQGGRDPDWTR